MVTWAAFSSRLLSFIITPRIRVGEMSFARADSRTPPASLRQKSGDQAGVPQRTLSWTLHSVLARQSTPGYTLSRSSATLDAGGSATLADGAGVWAAALGGMAAGANTAPRAARARQGNAVAKERISGLLERRNARKNRGFSARFSKLVPLGDQEDVFAADSSLYGF